MLTLSGGAAAAAAAADFGLAVNHVVERPVTRLGTLDYMAPEVRLVIFGCCACDTANS
jgi:serine/threonine protein kinase